MGEGLGLAPPPPGVEQAHSRADIEIVVILFMWRSVSLPDTDLKIAPTRRSIDEAGDSGIPENHGTAIQWPRRQQ